MNRFLNQIICGDNVTVMRQMPDKCIDLTVTSPPYDDMRTYKGFSFNREKKRNASRLAGIVEKQLELID